MEYVIAPKAEQDIDDISHYISQDNPTAAVHWFNNILSKFETLTEFPEIGRDIGYIRNGVRVLTVKNYLIFYSHEMPKVKILRVLHGARDWENLF